MGVYQHKNPWAEKLLQVSLPDGAEAWRAMESRLDAQGPRWWNRDTRRWVLLILLLLLLIGVCNCPGRGRLFHGNATTSREAAPVMPAASALAPKPATRAPTPLAPTSDSQAPTPLAPASNSQVHTPLAPASDRQAATPHAPGSSRIIPGPIPPMKRTVPAEADGQRLAVPSTGSSKPAPTGSTEPRDRAIHAGIVSGAKPLHPGYSSSTTEGRRAFHHPALHHPAADVRVPTSNARAGHPAHIRRPHQKNVPDTSVGDRLVAGTPVAGRSVAPGEPSAPGRSATTGKAVAPSTSMPPSTPTQAGTPSPPGTSSPTGTLMPPGTPTGSRVQRTPAVNDSAGKKPGHIPPLTKGSPAKDSSKKKPPAPPKEEEQKEKDNGFMAAIGLNQFFPLDGQQSVYNSSGTSGTLSDYIPVPVLRYYFNRKLYVQLEAQINTPQATKKSLVISAPPPDTSTILGASIVSSASIQQLFYFNVPLSVHYTPFDNFDIGVGLQFSRLSNAIGSFDTSVTYTVIPNNPPPVNSKDVKSFKGQALYQQIKTDEFRFLIDMSYTYKHFILGLRYNQALSRFVDVQVAPGQITQGRNSSLQLYLRYILWDGRKKRVSPAK